MITDALARAPGATANDADQVLLKLKVIIKQQLIERAAINAPPQATQPEPDVEWCKNAAKLLSNPWADAYQKQVMLELMRNRACLR